MACRLFDDKPSTKQTLNMIENNDIISTDFMIILHDIKTPYNNGV